MSGLSIRFEVEGGSGGPPPAAAGTMRAAPPSPGVQGAFQGAKGPLAENEN